jgi:hypothetical protein
MAIHKKDRKFSKIMDDVELETIPAGFVKKLTITLEDDSEINIDREDLEEVDTLESFLVNMDFGDEVANIRVELDFTEIERLVTENVRSIFDKFPSQDDKSNNSL